MPSSAAPHLKFTDPQSKWLERIAKQSQARTVVDRAALDTGQFKAERLFDSTRSLTAPCRAVLNELAEQSLERRRMKGPTT